jgi:hypothetical protein
MYHWIHDTFICDGISMRTKLVHSLDGAAERG